MEVTKMSALDDQQVGMYLVTYLNVIMYTSIFGLRQRKVSNRNIFSILIFLNKDRTVSPDTISRLKHIYTLYTMNCIPTEYACTLI